MSLRVLVVDDDPLVRRSVERILVRAGYAVSTAASVDEALKVANQAAIDAALVDYGLASESGLQVLSRLRDSQPSCLRILMTGRTDFPMVVEAVNRGEVLRVVRKPFDARGLVELIEDAFASARRMQEVASGQQQLADQQERQMLDECFEQRHLKLALQPIVSATTREPVAFEALLRSSHPVLNGPLPVLKAAERTHRIPELGRTVFALGAEKLAQLPQAIGLFINLHSFQLREPAQLGEDLAVLAPFASRVTLEITERSRLADIEGWERSIDVVLEAGISLAIDDLGAGYNSLSMLADLQPRYIKLDMSLVRNVHNDQRKQRLVHLMATFSEATGALLIAEGVETEAEARTLVECGTPLMQGYFYGRPQLELPVQAAHGK